MEFDNSFEVPLPPAEAWPVLMDIKRIATCIPGADRVVSLDQGQVRGEVQGAYADVVPLHPPRTEPHPDAHFA